MRDYEALFTSGKINSSVLHWQSLSINIVLAYAGLFFQQIAQNKHDYDKDPLFTLKKHSESQIIYIVPTTYFIDLINQSPFFAPLYNRNDPHLVSTHQNNKHVFCTNKTEVSYQFELKNITSSPIAYEFMHERYKNEIYHDEIDDVYQSAQTYHAILKEKNLLTQVGAKRNKNTQHDKMTSTKKI